MPPLAALDAGRRALFVGPFGQQLIDLFFVQRKRQGAHHDSDHTSSQRGAGRRGTGSRKTRLGSAWRPPPSMTMRLTLTRCAERERKNQGQPVSGAVRLAGEPAQYNQGAAADAEFAENMLEMFLDGVFHDTELPGHLFVGESLAQKPDNLLLAFGEHVRGADPIAIRLCIDRVREYLPRRRAPPLGLSPLTLAALDQGRFGARGRPALSPGLHSSAAKALVSGTTLLFFPCISYALFRQEVE